MSDPALEAVAAIDVGGTRVKAALVDARLEVLTELTSRTDDRLRADPAQAVAEVVDRLRAAVPGVAVRAVGVVVPGLVDDDQGRVRTAVNLGWTDLPLRELVAARLGLPVAVGHDVRAGLLAEHERGAARGSADVLFLPIGTGIAAAVMVDGRLLRAGGWAGEIGHVVVDPRGRRCGCGASGCLEAMASASGIGGRYSEATGTNTSAQEVAALVAAGDALARQVWDSAVEHLAQVLATTVMATGVERIVIGGGLALSGGLLLDPLRENLHARLTLGRRPEVVVAQLGDRAGCLGAAMLGWEVSP